MRKKGEGMKCINWGTCIIFRQGLVEYYKRNKAAIHGKEQRAKEIDPRAYINLNVELKTIESEESG
ncbi:hypothetical protein [Paenibacillus sp. N3.4]|uniref:hypothetical protein n=1 Tax=Paenibacillus sp. N3.4 TaxID=2603222 RepID=UPI0011CBFF39|nr:hypothetical protein [Paenibacillus sp. N3.4]